MRSGVVSATKEDVRRFRREVRILSSLDHPNIVRVVGLGLTRKPPFYVMPLYKRSLAQELPSLVGDESRIRPVFESVLDGIEYAHSQGVIHRDLGARNVLLNNDTDVVISDFGLGREFDADSTRQTQTGFGLGTPFYMAPEQIADAKNADERSDVYSLGRLLYEMYTGALSLAPMDLADLPGAIALVVRKCTKPDPDKRYQSVAQLKQVWRSIFDAGNEAAQLEKLQALLVELSSSTVERKKVEELVEQLTPRLDDSDLAHQVVVALSVEALQELWENDRGAFEAMIAPFLQLVADQGWGFDYTDRLGSRCRELFEIVSDFELRAKIVKAVTILGVDHNRWHVMRIARSLLQAPKEPGEAAPLAEELAEIGESRLEAIEAYLDVASLDPLLKPLFEVAVRALAQWARAKSGSFSMACE